MRTAAINSLCSQRPALAAAVLLIAGISAHPWIPTYPLVWVAVAAALIVMAAMLMQRTTICSCLIGSAVVFAGLASGQLASFYFSRNDIGAFVGDNNRLAWIEARLVDTPRVIDRPARGRKLPEKQRFTVEVRAVKTWKGWITAQGEVPVTLSPPREDLAAGTVVRMLGQLARPAPAMNPGGFDAAAHYRRQRILVCMHVSRPYDVQVAAGPGRLLSPVNRLLEFTRRMLQIGFEHQQATDCALLDALVFGDRDPAMHAVDDDFRETGTSHVLAANGARVAMLAAIVYLLCRLLRLSPRLTLTTVTLLTALFGFLTLPAAQAIRPVIVCTAIGMGLLGRRYVDSLQLLALAAIALLVLRPLDLYGPGFQLSFVIVLGLILFARPVARWIEARFEDPDQQAAQRGRTPTAWQRRRLWVRHWLIQATAAAVVGWVVAIPLVAYHFEQFNPWTVPFSLFLSPLAAAALFCGFAKIALTAICPPLAGAWATLVWAAPALLRHAVGLMASVPGADLPITSPHVWQIFLFYGLLLLSLVHWPRRAVRWCARCAPAGACALIVVLPWCGGMAASNAAPGGSVRITLLSVGAGQCAVVEPSGGGTVLLDAGSSSGSDVLSNVIAPFLRHEQCVRIDSLWLSHGDYDHISAAQQIVPDYGVHEVITSPYFRRHAIDSRPCQLLLRVLDRTSHSPHLVCRGNHFHVGNGVDVSVLWPPANCSFNSNNAGLVLRLTCAGHSVLFPADIQEPAERELLKHPEQLKSDVLVAPHHGSAEETTLQFIRAVNPKFVVSSNDSRLTRKQRLFDTEVTGIPLYRTSRYGAITIEVGTSGSIKVVPYHGQSTIVPNEGW